MKTVIAYLRLMRPANILTAIADIMLGYAVTGSVIEIWNSEEKWLINPDISALLWLVIATIGLYGGGVVFNDVFDAELDKVERPERPIPSGKASIAGGSILGALLLLTGVLAAWQVSAVSAILACVTAALALIYDKIGKHHDFFGPLNMGACRGTNLLLGMSAVTATVYQYWYIALIPVVYISAITMISRGEVHGKNLKALQGGMGLYLLVVLSIAVMGVLEQYHWHAALPFLMLFAYLIFPPLVKAIRKQRPQLIGRAVKAGVLSLIVMDSAIAAGFAGIQYGLLILLLLPVSMLLAKAFAVT
ncbi:UbiA-like protein EboC [Rapidithrix thailandica]|uniref:UbiA-like protein EboC n=1 Tax=Rapidithrix thailandica TaxID=413964 RepID=A0AAW9S2B8_9BACT